MKCSKITIDAKAESKTFLESRMRVTSVINDRKINTKNIYPVSTVFIESRHGYSHTGSRFTVTVSKLNETNNGEHFRDKTLEWSFKTSCWLLLCDSVRLWRAGAEGTQMGASDTRPRVPGIVT